MRIAIVDDDKVFVEKLQRELENFFQRRTCADIQF